MKSDFKFFFAEAPWSKKILMPLEDNQDINNNKKNIYKIGSGFQIVHGCKKDWVLQIYPCRHAWGLHILHNNTISFNLFIISNLGGTEMGFGALSVNVKQFELLQPKTVTVTNNI